MILLLLACGDRDYDGFVGGDDCAPDDPLVYPGAPDVPGDGIDSDCDGEDAPYRFVGDWDLVDLAAEFAGIQAVEPGQAFGSIVVHDASSMEARLTVPVSPDLVALTLPLNVQGDVSPLPLANDFHVSIRDVLLDEQINIEWDCSVDPGLDEDDDVLGCAGALLVLGVNLDSSATFERR